MCASMSMNGIQLNRYIFQIEPGMTVKAEVNNIQYRKMPLKLE